MPLDCGRALAEAWPNAALRITRGLAHRRILQDTRVLDDIVRFVDD